MKFLLDANFLMAVGQFKVDIFTQLRGFGKPEFYTLDSVVKELKKIEGWGGKDGRHAKLALMLIEKKGVEILKSRDVHTDRELNRLARMGYTVCTQDKELINGLITKGIEVYRIIRGSIVAKA